MRASPISFILAAMLTAIPAAADYSSIQHNLFSPNAVVTFDHITGELHIVSMNQGQLTLNDASPLSGMASSIGLELVTTFDHVDSFGYAHFWGGSLNLSFNFDPAGPAPAAAHQISGPIVGFLFEITQLGSNSRIDALGWWVATAIDLPGSGNWPDWGQLSILDSLSMAFNENLSDFHWDRSITGRVESLYSLYPGRHSETCFRPSRFTLAFNASTRLLSIENDAVGLSGYAFSLGQCLDNYVLETYLDAVTSNGTAFFTGGTLQTSASADFVSSPAWAGNLQGQTKYLALAQRANTDTVALSGAGRWDPTATNLNIPWPDDSAICGFDGLSHLAMHMVVIDETPPVGIDWTTDWNAIAYGANLDLAPQSCPITTCTYPFGDLELDCDVDLRDYAAAQRCLAGTASVADKIAGLRVLDSDGDLDTDLADFALWQMDGPESAPQSCCTTQ